MSEPRSTPPDLSAAFVLMLRWTCQACGWSVVIAAPGFAGDGRLHYPDGEHGCGPIMAQKASAADLFEQTYEAVAG